jgi:hypothetical protein
MSFQSTELTIETNSYLLQSRDTSILAIQSRDTSKFKILANIQSRDTSKFYK